MSTMPNARPKPKIKSVQPNQQQSKITSMQKAQNTKNGMVLR